MQFKPQEEGISMCIYIDSVLLFILCSLVYPAFKPDPVHITGVLFLITIY